MAVTVFHLQRRFVDAEFMHSLQFDMLFGNTISAPSKDFRKFSTQYIY